MTKEREKFRIGELNDQNKESVNVICYTQIVGTECA